MLCDSIDTYKFLQNIDNSRRLFLSILFFYIALSAFYIAILGIVEEITIRKISAKFSLTDSYLPN